MPESSGAEERARPWLAAYPPGVPAEVDVPDGSLVELIERSVARFGRAVALRFFGRDVTYAQLGDRIERVAEALRRAGVAPGDRVALVLPNCPQHVVAFYAALRLGAVVVEHNPLYTAAELARQFDDHEAGAAIVWNRVAATVAALPAPIRPRIVVSVDLTTELPVHSRLLLRLPLPVSRAARAQITTSSTTPGSVPWRRLLRGPRLDPAHPRPTADSLAAVQYTSGTTGSPKGAMLTHRNLVANAAQGRAWMPDLRPGRETVYGVLPLFHAYGLTLCLTFAMSIGARLVLFPRFDVDQVLDAMRRSPATVLPGVPPMYERLIAAAGRRGVSLSGIRYAISGAMSLPPTTIRSWERITGGLLVEGYGLSETSPVVIGNPMGPRRRPGTIGIPFPSTDVRVVDPDSPDRDRAIDTPGELLVRGPQVFTGYWRKPAETAAALLPGGWFRTGDVVSMSRDGFVTMLDRIKELIVVGGFKVAPSEVEERLLEHPDVAGAAVVGVPGGALGDQVVAAVVLNDGAVLDAPALRAFCREHLAAYKVPARIVRVSSLPVSPLGKVLRREVRSTLLEGGAAAPKR